MAGEADLSGEWAAFAPEWIERMASAGDRAREGLQSLTGVADETYDLAVSYISLVDVPDEGPRDIPFPSGHRITNHHRRPAQAGDPSELAVMV